ncbi:flagellar basal body P-ring formation chaperone FlgA [Jiella sonneratiae]|uniref:Flagella basal body P-ring formation protein FlgA n=1 Tax=Jiella sonneratiae TaxID=2816856 RepID=A0ABS3J1S0_9HYPH|nr:flagellar basal body P-ring formation chaperone FlgA [Jiella sonneratiae]MBO0903630.1 flagellar basal body P-ring formation protein FlgA [Jiella sonneratiae]
MAAAFRPILARLRSAGRSPGGRLLLGASLAAAVSGAAAAAELTMPVPTAIVYPGQSIVERGLGTGDFIVKDDKVELFVLDQKMLQGMVAKRTLLPGNAIRVTDIALPDLVKAGAQVSMVYRGSGLVITALGTALRSGAEGDEVTARNVDSGVVVSGIVEPDGTIRIVE